MGSKGRRLLACMGAARGRKLSFRQQAQQAPATAARGAAESSSSGEASGGEQESAADGLRRRRGQEQEAEDEAVRQLPMRKSQRMSEVRVIVSTEVQGDGSVAVVKLLGGDAKETFPWGTRVCEHRVNPHLIESIDAALDAALADENVCAVVVTGEGKFFSNGMDLKWIDANPAEADELQRNTEALLARILTFPLPTIAAINGHFCAAGAMLGLAFDYRIMNVEKGLFFVPAIDIGLVYSPGMTELMKAKTPVHMHNDMIVYAKRYGATDLVRENVVVEAVKLVEVVSVSLQFARELVAKGRFKGPKYRETMESIKRRTYTTAYKALTDEESFQGLGFEDGTWDESGKSKL
ncbi:Enoyl-CoA hydratase, mitochondrial [Hondaea fermentalgiana]|uniref:Enoyl-CoA hydratase, mitochondrial n=1 Tax=Hondaea fermentalgiana TaxID=2315210 RepID=A0A2R5GSJ1_9STRA|nr:Enoyl-CoA hydratase, mitochondrial [Hondaea fermentalgiana]|eukprot:GBG31613.1 Enoyl-CoA hydratase, mitochondrial [Hondaea fermentalgiana]